jgi:hypothetical protein
LHAALNDQIRGDLMRLRGPQSTWSYRLRQVPSVEPTALACLGLLASADPMSCAGDSEVCLDAAKWMASLSRADGSLPVSRHIETNGWTTPHAMLLWSQFSDFGWQRRRAVDWLLRVKGRTLPGSERSDRIVGHDTALVGWPWVEGTHSWLEPTALAILALRKEGFADHPRVQAGVRLIGDRALTRGGWSAAGKSFFGHEVRPQPAPTGLALVALAACGVQGDFVNSAVSYLADVLPSTRAPISLGWGLLGMRSHGVWPTRSASWVAESYERVAARDDRALGTAVLLLALCEGSPALLGARPPVQVRTDADEGENPGKPAACQAKAPNTTGEPS